MRNGAGSAGHPRPHPPRNATQSSCNPEAVSRAAVPVGRPLNAGRVLLDLWTPSHPVVNLSPLSPTNHDDVSRHIS
eukprot:1266552-Amphidinium_carterae.1